MVAVNVIDTWILEVLEVNFIDRINSAHQGFLAL